MTKITRYVTKFQTSDGKEFDSELDAITHEFTIEMRGVVQSRLMSRTEQVTIGAICQCITENVDIVAAILRKHQAKVRGFKSRKVNHPLAPACGK